MRLIFKNSTVLEKIFFLYLISIPFYIVLRSMVYDTRWWRDGFIIAMFLIVVIKRVYNSNKLKINMLDIIMLLYFSYGAIGCILHDIIK